MVFLADAIVSNKLNASRGSKKQKRGNGER